MHDICCVNLPWSAKARLRKLSLQLPHLSVFSLIKRVFRDVLKEMFPSGNIPTPETMEKKRNALAEERSVKHDEYLSLKAKVSELEKAHKTVDDFLRQEKIAVKKRKKETELF